MQKNSLNGQTYRFLARNKRYKSIHDSVNFQRQQRGIKTIDRQIAVCSSYVYTTRQLATLGEKNPNGKKSQQKSASPSFWMAGTTTKPSGCYKTPVVFRCSRKIISFTNYTHQLGLIFFPSHKEERKDIPAFKVAPVDLVSMADVA